MNQSDEFRLHVPVAEGTAHAAAYDQCEDEVVMMGDEDVLRGELLAELKGLREDVRRIEKRIEKDADELYERLRVAEVDVALVKQNLESTRSTLKRDIAVLAGIVGTITATIATALINFVAK